MLGDSNNYTNMIRGMELPMNEAKVAKESTWLFYPLEI